MANEVCTVEIIKDSIGPNGIRLTTFLLEYPRIIHGELMTHRVFSRNASSSRAIPALTMIERIRHKMFIPLAFQKTHKGMQGNEYLEGTEKEIAITEWNKAGKRALDIAQHWAEQNLFTKQLINRIVEPFSFIKVVVTSTEWSNFFDLRNHPAAEIHIQDLAKKMQEKYVMNVPELLKVGQWHLPFITDAERNDLSAEICVKVSVARCARTSYYNNYGKTDYKADVELYEKLAGGIPKHLSPTEHQARCINVACVNPVNILEIPDGLEVRITNKNVEFWSGNLKGWIQFRKLIE
jgi:hypothetical protein